MKRLIRRVKKLLGFCEYQGCWRRSDVVVDIKSNDKLVATRELCIDHVVSITKNAANED